MSKERIKTIVITALCVSSVFLAYTLWFGSGILNYSAAFSFSDLPFVQYFEMKNHTSVPKENLSKPRKIVINDGSLWIPYYNTDTAFETLDDKTSEIILACLHGEGKSEKISYDDWLDSLTGLSIYVEYPIVVSPELLAVILDGETGKFPPEISHIKDAIIIPSGDDSVMAAIRDYDDNEAFVFTLDNPQYAIPDEILATYADRNQREGYYEFAFNTMLGESGLGESAVAMDDLVLFSDNYAMMNNITASNPIEGRGYSSLLKGFSFNPQPLRQYHDERGSENYVENYATVKIYPSGYVEYSAVAADKGIYLTDAEDSEYEILNSAIDFAEKLWSTVSDEPLNVLVSGVDETVGGSRFTFDYYYGGREIAVSAADDGHAPLYHAIEIETEGGRIVSYRQYLRSYSSLSSSAAQQSFVEALDYFVESLAPWGEVTITDLYPGFYDDGTTSVIQTTWLAAVSTTEERLKMN